MILARAGARVRLVDRARFPRAKLCGDTLNPGACRVLSRYLPLAEIVDGAITLDGMVLTGPAVEICGRYPSAVHAYAITRRDLDRRLLDCAMRSGAQFQDQVTTEAPVIAGKDGIVTGVVVRSREGGRKELTARMVLAADGRESRLARAASIARHARWPRRWAIGGYFDGVAGLGPYGEMHIRRGHYIGVAPLPGGLANACVVIPANRRDDGWRDPAALLIDRLRRDVRLGDRFAQARLVEGPHVLGPMAVDTVAAGVPGLLLAGDAAGFIDPITGDGLRFALAGAAIAANVTLEVLDGRLDAANAVRSLAARRKAAFGAKWRFNRAIRHVVARPPAISAAAATARFIPSAFQALIRYAGDCQTNLREGKACPEP
jgi:flavin-dependent dehydrogenase